MRFINLSTGLGVVALHLNAPDDSYTQLYQRCSGEFNSGVDAPVELLGYRLIALLALALNGMLKGEIGSMVI